MAKPKPKRFAVTFTAIVDINPAILRTAKSKAWAKEFYTFTTDEQVAMFVAYNLIRDIKLNSIDGFADRKETEARLVELTTDDAVPA